MPNNATLAARYKALGTLNAEVLVVAASLFNTAIEYNKIVNYF